jgi:hypothetical protein
MSDEQPEDRAEPTQITLMWACSECGATCPKANETFHKRWHERLAGQLHDLWMRT